MPDEMVILSRVFDLLAWLLPKSERFPRVYRATVTQRLMDAALDVQDRLFDAQSRRGGRQVEASCRPRTPRSAGCACTCDSPTTGGG